MIGSERLMLDLRVYERNLYLLNSKSDNEITVSESEAMGKVAAVSILAWASGKCGLGLGLG